MKKRHSLSGFTLVELSVVFVIIGLVAGGVLVGSSLIESAGVRGTITEIQKIRTAYTWFENKYDCIPGDCAQAEEFFPSMPNGDGDGVIECHTCEDDAAPINEQIYAMLEMQEAGFLAQGVVNGSYQNKRIQIDCQFFFYGDGGDDVYGDLPQNHLRVVERIDEAPWSRDCLLPREAESIDSKMDDGYASNGKVKGRRYDEDDNTECADKPYNEGKQDKAVYNIANDLRACTLYISR